MADDDVCPDCENKVKEGQIRCKNCGKLLENKDWEGKIDSVVKLVDDIEEEDLQLPSLEKTVENKLVSTLRAVEKDIRSSLKEEFQAREEKIRDRYKREKIELKEELNQVKDELNDLRENTEKKREELREKYEQEKKELRERLQEEKDDLRYRLEKEKIELKERYGERITDLKKELENQREKEDKKIRGEKSSGFMFFSKEKIISDTNTWSKDLEKRLDEPIYPFPAIVDQEKIKRAFLLNVINPKINGVLIWGQEGLGKTTALISTAELVAGIEEIQMKKDENIKVWNDKNRYLTGDINTEKGPVKIIIDTMLGNVAMTVVDQNSLSKRVTPILKAGEITPFEKHILYYIDSLDLHVKADNISDHDERAKIIHRRDYFERNPEEFYMNYEDEIYDLRDRIIKARQKLPDVNVDKEIIDKISDITERASLGPSADLKVKEVSKTVAAYEERENILERDVKTAADLLLTSDNRGESIKNK